MVAGMPQVTTETPVAKAVAVMLESDRKVLAVVDASGRLQGIVDRADLLRGVAAAPAESGPSAAR
jgi:CBS domain-containing protein